MQVAEEEFLPDESEIELEVNYKPDRNEPYMCKKHLVFFKNKLLTWKEALQNETASAVESLKQESLDEPDMTDRAAAEEVMSFELKQKCRMGKLITQIDAALKRISDGSYGYCEETGEKIGLERLMVRPVARMCIEAQEAHEKFERRHNKIITHEKLEDSLSNKV